MDVTEIIIIALALAMDASAVSLAASASGYADNVRAKFRLSFHFGLFQALMPVIGWYAGENFVVYIAAYDHWIAFALLSIIAVNMILSGFKVNIAARLKDPTRGVNLMMLSIATSIDALAVGLSLAFLEVSIWYPALLIGIMTAILSLIAIRFGKKLSTLFGQRMEIIGGIILIGIGLRILYVHLGL